MAFVLLLGHEPGPEARHLDAAGVPWRHVRLLDYASTGAQPPEPSPPDHLLVTSGRTFESVSAEQLARTLAPARLYVVGGRTAAAARAVGLEPVHVGGAGGAELVAEVRRQLGVGERVWLVGAAELARPTRAALAGWDGPVPVRHWAVYRAVEPPGLAEALCALPTAALAVFTSPAQVRRFTSSGGRAEAAVAIGPTTAAALEAAGLPLAGALAERFSRDRLGRLAASCWRELSRAGPG